MNTVSCASIPSDDLDQLREIIGYHCRLIQSPVVQQHLAAIPNIYVLDTMIRGGANLRAFSDVVDTFRHCQTHGKVIVAKRGNTPIGYAAYTSFPGRKLGITHRANEPVAFINFFRVADLPTGQHDADTAIKLVTTMLDELREHSRHFRIAYRFITPPENVLTYLAQIMKPTALGFDDYGTWRVAGLNAADLSLGIIRRPAKAAPKQPAAMQASKL